MIVEAAKQEAPTQTQEIECSRPASTEHLIALPGSQWAFWRCVGLRSAGFPAEAVLRLAGSAELIDAADAALRAESAVTDAKARALQEINQALNRLRESGDWNHKEKRIPLVDALQKLKMDHTPTLPAAFEGSFVLEDLRRERDEAFVALDAFKRAFSGSSVQNSRVLHEIAAWPAFREAVTWQNRKAVHTALDTLLRRPIDGRPPTSKSRQDEELVASYLQRYCVKNDTIGFFGPVGWAEFVSSGPALSAQPGPQLLATRQVYFESWPMEALAKTITGNPDVFPWLLPIRMPFVRLKGSILHHPVYGSRRISADQAAVLRACDGRFPAKKIANTLIREMGPIRGEVQFYRCLSELAGQGLVFWDFNIPLEAHPECTLREALQRIEDLPLRRGALDMLDELEHARQDVAAASGDAQQLDRALENLEQTFTRLTGLDSTRGAGKTYAGRTIVYEDCRRDLNVLLGPELLETLATPLSLLLLSARWLTWEFAVMYRNKFSEIYSELASGTNESHVDAALFFQRAAPFLSSYQGGLGRPVQEQFQAKWERILRIGLATEPLRYSTEDLRAEVEQEFAAPRPGWDSARYHSPDIMIVAASQEAVERGDYLLAMGELHVGGNTLSAGLFVNQHPSPEDLVRAAEYDLGTPKAIAFPPRDTPELLARTFSGLVSSKDFRLEYAKDGFISDRSKALAISSLVVVETDGVLTASTRDGRRHFDIIDLVGGLIHGMVVDSFRMIGARPRTPRISIDRLVIKRASWRFPPETLIFAQQKHPADRFLATRRWAQACGLPRFCFFKVPVERKPAYLDLHSPTLVDIFCKAVRRTCQPSLDGATVDLTEMLPGLDQIWLNDASGRLYTSELRIVAVDLTR